MIVNLNNLDVRHVKELITWCIANDVDKERANKLLFAWYESPPGYHVWELDIPDEHLTYFILKWQ